MGSLPKSLPRPRLPEGWPRMPRIWGLTRTGRSSRSRRSLPPWRVVRRWLIAAAICLLALGAAYMFWFRSSSYVKVEEVKITGAEQVPEVDSALRAAADGQSTLHPDADALRAAVAGNPLVAGLKVDTDFPHTMLIDVQVREPVAYLDSEGVVVAADGTILDHTGEAPDGVPAIKVDADKDGGEIVSGDAVSGDALEISRVLGSVPGPLAGEINSAETTKDYGVSVDIGPGLELRFGDSAGAALKWKAVVAVLADPKFEGASYLDLSVPDRPVAGGVPETTDTVDPAVVPVTDPTLATVP